jgi:hypothetical protein
MTLVLSCITQNFAIKVSDRRFMDFRTGKPLVDDGDDRNKAVMWERRACFAFTGFASLGPKDNTPLWLAEILVKRTFDTLDDTLNLIATEAATEIKAIPLPEDKKRHSFEVVFWADIHGRPEWGPRPFYTFVSNFHDRDGRQLPVAHATFTVGRLTCLRPDHLCLMREAGQPIAYPEQVKLKRAVTRATKRGADGVAIGRTLADAILTIAHRNRGGSVGPNLMLTAVPRTITTPEGQGGVLLGPPQPGEPTLLSLSANGREISYSPVIVGGGLIVWGGMGSTDPAMFEKLKNEPPTFR